MDLDTWLIDAITVRASRAAAEVKKTDEPVAHALGRSRGGLSIKIHQLTVAMVGR